MSVVFEVVVVFLVIVSILPEVSTVLVADESTLTEVDDESADFDEPLPLQAAIVAEITKADKPNLIEFFILFEF